MKGTIKFSMNGFRGSLSEDVRDLRDLVTKVIRGYYESDDYCDMDELADAMNTIITSSNVLNCIFDDENESFSDMSDLEVEHIDHEGLIQGKEEG